MHGYHLRRVLSKFPRLRVAFLESGVGWIGYWLDRMDGHFEKMGHYVPWLKAKNRASISSSSALSPLDPDERTLQGHGSPWAWKTA